MLYQSDNSLSSELLKIEENKDFNFPKHLHNSFEFILVRNGEMMVTVDDTEYLLKKGESVLIFPNQMHSLHTLSHSSHFLCIFSQKLVQAYNNVYQGKIPIDNRAHLQKNTLAMITSLRADTPSTMKIKGALYTLCGEFDTTADYRDRIGYQSGLLEKIFGFVESSYSTNCTLEALSEHTSYHYVYLSRYFKKCTGLSFTDYVIRYRVNEAEYILKNSSQSVLKIAMDCGFDSLRSFNRNFKRVTGQSPLEYRKSGASETQNPTA